MQKWPVGRLSNMYIYQPFIVILLGTHGNVFLRFCIVYCSQGNREQPAHYLKQYKNAGKRFRVYGALDDIYLFICVFLLTLGTSRISSYSTTSNGPSSTSSNDLSVHHTVGFSILVAVVVLMLRFRM